MLHFPTNKVTHNQASKEGQSLVMLLVFVVVATTIATAAVTILISSSRNVSTFEGGESVYVQAESGIESALLRILRDPNFTGETFIIDNTTITTTVVGGATKTITSVATAGGFRRTLQAQVVNSAGILTISSWQELP